MSRFFSRVWQFLKRHWLLVSILALLTIGGGIWWFTTAAAQKEALTFIKPERQNLTKTLEISGVIDAREKARMRFAAGGKVTRVNVTEGSQVKKSEVLAVIDQATLQRQIQQDLNTYMQERWDWEQLQDDTKDRTLPTDELRQKDQANWDLQNKVLSVEIKSIAIRDTVLRAPFPGIVTSVPTVVPGIVLSATDYFEIVNPETIEFVAEVDEADIAKVQVGQSATLTLDAFPDEILNSTVTSIAYASKQGESGTVFEVTFAVNPAQTTQQLRLGMNGDIAIELESKAAVLTVPLIVTRQRDGKVYVDVRTGAHSYEEREIQIGLETDENVEVLSGLQEEDEVLSPESP
jgi:RND family efflux transporter MFP subunit